MDNFRLTVIVLTAVALVWSMMLTGLFGIFFVAMLGAMLTVGLITGSLAPIYPAISRIEAPAKFWSVMIACASVVALNIINLIFGR